MTAAVAVTSKLTATKPAILTVSGLTAGYGDVQVLSIAFQLLNMVEENAAAQGRRRRESTEGLMREPGLWGQNLRQLLDAGFSGQQIADALSTIRVEAVLTG